VNNFHRGRPVPVQGTITIETLLHLPAFCPFQNVWVNMGKSESAAATTATTAAQRLWSAWRIWF